MALNYNKFKNDQQIYSCNKDKIYKTTILKDNFQNQHSQYNKFHVNKKFDKNDTINKKFTFHFNKDLYHAFNNFTLTCTKNWDYVQLLVNDIGKSTITKEQYEFYTDENVNKINVSKIFFGTSKVIPCDNISIRIKFKEELNINDSIIIDFIACLFLYDMEKKKFENEYPFKTYRKQIFNFDLSKQTQSITIDRNIPFTFIIISFNQQSLEDSYEYLSIDDHENINMTEDSFESIDMENIELIHKNINGKSYWFNSCIDIEQNCSFFYPNEWKINFKLKNTLNYNIKGVIQYFIGNKIKLDGESKGKLCYPNHIAKIEYLPSNPFVKFNDTLYGEGYWHSKIDNKNVIEYADDNDSEILLPYPRQQEYRDTEFYNKLNNLRPLFQTRVMKHNETDRFGDKLMNPYEYYFTYNNIEYKFPESYFCYLYDYNVHPSSEFKNIIESIWQENKDKLKPIEPLVFKTNNQINFSLFNPFIFMSGQPNTEQSGNFFAGIAKYINLADIGEPINLTGKPINITSEHNNIDDIDSDINNVLNYDYKSKNLNI